MRLLRLTAAKRLRDSNAIDALTQSKVAEHDIGLKSRGQLYRLLTTGSVSDNGDSPMTIEHGFETRANHWMVIDDQDRDGGWSHARTEIGTTAVIAVPD